MSSPNYRQARYDYLVLTIRDFNRKYDEWVDSAEFWSRLTLEFAAEQEAENQELHHLARPGPLYWDYRCRFCGGSVDQHPSVVRLVWRHLASIWGRVVA